MLTYANYYIDNILPKEKTLIINTYQEKVSSYDKRLVSSMLLNALSITNGYLIQNYSKSELSVIREEIKKVLGKNDYSVTAYKEMYSYEEVQEILSNINEKEDIRKAKGVYYTNVSIKGKIFKGITSVGHNPTVNGKELTIETNILDFNEYIYGQTINVSFINKIREEIKFNGLEELVNQLKIDKSYAEKNNIII